MLIGLRVAPEVAARLEHVPAVTLIGLREAGKTTFAPKIAESPPAV
jgi:predicted AAA+ superfamily ATPase